MDSLLLHWDDFLKLDTSMQPLSDVLQSTPCIATRVSASASLALECPCEILDPQVKVLQSMYNKEIGLFSKFPHPTFQRLQSKSSSDKILHQPRVQQFRRLKPLHLRSQLSGEEVMKLVGWLCAREGQHGGQCVLVRRCVLLPFNCAVRLLSLSILRAFAPASLAEKKFRSWTLLRKRSVQVHHPK
jgi:hypothetical protein